MAEKRYRFGKPSTGLWGHFKKYSSFIYMFAAWNLLGYTIYKIVDEGQRKSDPTWDEKTSTEKYMSSLNVGTSRVEKVVINPFNVEKKTLNESSD